MTHGRKIRRTTPALLALTLAIAGLAGCLPPAAPTSLAVNAAPGLVPDFATSVTDYVVRCAGGPVTVTVEAPTGTSVSVDGGASMSGRFTVAVPLTTDEAFTITVQRGASPTTHRVRCLPSDFPAWTATRSGSTRAAYYLATPIEATTSWYPVILDAGGVPVWWGDRVPTIFTTLLPDGNMGSVTSAGLEVRTLAGDFVRSVATVGGDTDQHDVALLPNGHVVLVANIPREHVDLSALGGPGDTSILDHVIQEIDPATGDVVWSWSTADHVAPTEMDPQWFAQFITLGTAPYDVFHWNSLDVTPTGYLLSFRHLDAVVAIEGATGDIEWKLGGATTAESLDVLGDPVFDGGSHLGGQHDARRLADGTVTVYDNGTQLGRTARGVRYVIDEVARTATMVESVQDAAVAGSFCCGNARRLAQYDWVMGWGGDVNEAGSENVLGQRAFSLHFAGRIAYRVVPLGSGDVTLAQLRAAMDERAAGLAVAGLGAERASPPVPGPGSFPFPP